MLEEHVATYIYDDRLSYGVYEVYAYYDSIRDRDNRNVSHYDIFDKNGVCVNEGSPYYSFPSWQEVFNHHYMPNVV